jgi:hypothetical protein
MPVCYSIVTNKTVRKYVDTNNLSALDEYMTNPDSEIDNTVSDDDDNSYDVNYNKDIPTLYAKKLYHITSYATDKANLLVLSHFENIIDLEYCPDGNSYELIHLAVENYIDNYSENNTIEQKKRYDTILFLLKTGFKNNCKINVELATRRLMSNIKNEESKIKNNDAFDLLTLMVRTYNVSISDAYHYSIVWNYPKAFDELITNFDDIIDYAWTDLALRCAFEFKKHIIQLNYNTIDGLNNNIINYVINKFKTLKPELYDKIKHYEEKKV